MVNPSTTMICHIIRPTLNIFFENITYIMKKTPQVWGEYWTYEYEYLEISTRVVLEYNVFSIFMFIVLGKTSTRVVLAPALQVGSQNILATKFGFVPDWYRSSHCVNKWSYELCYLHNEISLTCCPLRDVALILYVQIINPPWGLMAWVFK